MKSPYPFQELAPPRQALNGAPVVRSARLPMILGAPKEFPSVIANLTVALIGTGAVGGAAGLHLARMQPAALYLIDPKKYKAESLWSQPIGPEAIGRSKALHIGELCKAISPGTQVFCYEGGIEDISLECLAGIDVFLLASDNLATEVEAAETALHLAVPLIQGSVHGPSLVAQVRTFAHRDGTGPCLACGFDRVEWLQMAEAVEYPCDAGSTSEPPIRTVHSQPTSSLSSLCSLAADLMVLHLLKLMIGFGRPMENTLYEYCGHTGRTYTTPLLRNPDCPCDHSRWDFQTTGQPLRETSLAELAGRVGLPITNADPPLFHVYGFEWVENLQCIQGHVQPHRRFVRQDESPAPCACDICGGPMAPELVTRRRAISATSLGSKLSTSLAQLGVDAADRIGISTATTMILIQFHPSSDPTE